MPGKGAAFLKGGIGCLGGFLLIGLLMVLIGGTMHIDIGGAILLFVIGGLVGLIVWWVYNKGYKKARNEEDNQSDSDTKWTDQS